MRHPVSMRRRELAADADAFWSLSRPILVRFSKFFFSSESL